MRTRDSFHIIQGNDDWMSITRTIFTPKKKQTQQKYPLKTFSKKNPPVFEEVPENPFVF